MKIALIQQAVGPDKKQNLHAGERALRDAVAAGAQLVVFPELAFTLFFPQKPSPTIPEHLAEEIPGPTTERFVQLARELEIVIVLNLFERAGSCYYDSSPVIDADGKLLGVTRMMHITDAPCFHEQDYYTPGDRGAAVYDTRVGRLGVAICYDRHYPEYMRALGLKGAELVVVPQAGALGEWPEGLFEAELRVAAFQNGYFAALANRVGAEECVTFAGESFAVDPAGQIIAQAPAGKDQILLVDVDLEEVASSHAKRHFLVDRRPDAVF